MLRPDFIAIAAFAVLAVPSPVQGESLDVQLGPRPFYLVDRMADGALKQSLQQCTGPFRKSDFSIGHRGAPLQFPKHTKESYEAAARMGAGVLECDVTFTRDRELVFRRLRGKMDAADTNAKTVDEYMNGTARWRTDLYAANGTLLTHEESIDLFKRLGTKFTPELKAPEVQMPFEGNYTQEQYAQQMIDNYKAAGIDPKQVYAQSFNLADVRYWIKREPAFGARAVFLDGRYGDKTFNHADPKTWKPGMQELAGHGVKILAPPIWMLLALNEGREIIPSGYAKAARDAGLDIITWTLERDGPLHKGGGWYHQTIKPAIDRDGDTYEVLEVLAKQVGVIGVFSDWPATTTFYANCAGVR